MNNKPAPTKSCPVRVMLAYARESAKYDVFHGAGPLRSDGARHDMALRCAEKANTRLTYECLQAILTSYDDAVSDSLALTASFTSL